MNLNLCVTAAVLLVASAVATADTKCQENKRVPHPDSCRKYMRCTKGKWVEDSCPLIEHFDSVEATCRNLFAGTCGHPQCREGDVGPVVADCKKYKECTGGKWITQECNLLHYFNPVNKECEFRYDCSATPKCQEGEQRAIPGDCTGYQVCQKGNFKDAKCSGLDKFNPTTKSCELLFKCDYCKPGPKQAVPKDCESYMICDKGVMKKESCSFGKSRFNPKTHECDWAWNVACDQPSPTVKPKATTTAVTPKRSTTTKKPLPKTPKPQPPKDKCYDKAARPVNGSCSQYFECEPSTGDFKLTSCRLCKNFHPGEGRCVWPWQYPCRDPTGQPPTQRPPECSNGQKHPVDCKIYQICIQGKWQTEQCSWGYHFDVVKLECRFAWWAKC